MPQYSAPLRDMQSVLHELLKVEDVLRTLPTHAGANRELIDQVLEEGGRFASQVLFPLNYTGDREGCYYNRDARIVTSPKGYREAYKRYVEAGWAALSCDPEFGGQGLPLVVNNAFYEMLNSSNQAWTMYPGLSHGAYACLHAHGSDEQKALYLPKLVSGEWSGTMCLTEAHCGTDLGLLRSKAEPQADGSCKITGSKIFISAGEHDMSDNIIHLVLARLPDAPQGAKGISLFVVPKFLPCADGSLGARNPITCGAIEEKMGIHGNATCQMNLDGATGWLIGEPHKGLKAMFVFMNAARLGVGMQGFIEEHGADEAMSEFISPLADICDRVSRLTMEIGMKALQSRDEVGAAAVAYLRVVGHLVYTYLFAQMAGIALEKQDSGDGFYKAKLATARFYFARLLPETATLIHQARSGSANLMALDADLF